MQNQNFEVVIEDGVVVVKQGGARDIFASEDNVKFILDMIKAEADKLEVDLSTTKGRKAVASMSAKISSSKVLLDNLGKELVAGWKEQAKVIDRNRKVARDELDELRDLVRKPLTDYEQEQERLAAEAQLKLQIEKDHDEALPLNKLFDLERKEEAQRKQEAAEQEKKERAAREQQIREEEQQRAKLEAEQAAERAVEQERLRVDAEKKKIAFEAAEKKAEEERIANNKRRQGQINRNAAEKIVLVISEVHSGNAGEADIIAKAIITAIVKGEIPNVYLAY